MRQMHGGYRGSRGAPFPGGDARIRVGILSPVTKTQKIFQTSIFNIFQASRSSYPSGHPYPACYLEIGVEACAWRRKSRLCFYLLPGREALHVSVVPD
jgi:hypothetical protein